MTFEDNISNFKKRLIDRGYPQTMIENPLSDINDREGVCTPETKQQRGKRNIAFRQETMTLAFVTQYQPSVSSLKEVLMKKWNLIQNQPLLRQILIPKGHAR